MGAVNTVLIIQYKGDGLMYKFDLAKLGADCKAWRIDKGYPRKAISIDTGYSIENVHAFEDGRNNNCKIFVWYLMHGFMFGGVNYGQNL